MEHQEYSVAVSHQNLDEERGSIADSLRYSSRKHRHEILSSHGYYALWLGEISLERYIQLLASHYSIRIAIEKAFDEIHDSFTVENQFFDDKSHYTKSAFPIVEVNKSKDLLADLLDISDVNVDEANILPKAKQFIEYIEKVKGQCDLALLGILYTLEETQVYAGPLIGNALNQKLNLNGKAIRYLAGKNCSKPDLWAFRKQLNSITDFQAQANVVIASTLSYRIYRDLLDPYANLQPKSKNRFHA